ncbi:histidine phosphatase family protein [Bacillus sp. 1P06AnD]|uniref:histidine phosphatase family protein n=1 Tax=Bacillus sp. 1P06AnD TaxID=3132208 RepID=UPI0039A2CB1E
MSKIVYCVRHCEAEGQEAGAELTEKGNAQASALSSFFAGIPLDRLVSSPYVRAIQSMHFIQKEREMDIRVDERLKERTLCIDPLDDWLSKLEESFHNPSLSFTGGESGAEAQKRITAAVEEMESGTTLLVSHGNILTLLLNQYDSSYGFKEWAQMTNPDVYRLEMDGGYCKVERIWNRKDRLDDCKDGIGK